MIIASIVIFVASILLNFIFLKVELLKGLSLFDAIRFAFIKTYIAFAFLCFISAELLSIFNGFNQSNLLIYWGLILTGLLFFAKFRFRAILTQCCNFLSSLEIEIRIYMVLTSVLIVIPLFFQALYVPPNNYDSMTYHMARIEHWRQNENVYPYPTGIIRQVIHNPLAEYIIANFLVISNTDFYSNLIQFFAWIGLLCSVTLILKKLNFGKYYQFVAAILFISIPMGVYQSTTTQNDLLATFFLVSFICFALDLRGEKLQLNEKFFLILALLLGGFTKYTVFVFALPFILYFGYIILTKSKIQDSLKFILISFFFLVLIYGPFLWRNYNTYGILTGDAETSSRMQNSSFNFTFGISNSIKNITDHFALPIGAVTNFLDQTVTKLHLLLGISKDDPGANFLQIPYNSSFILSENSTGSIIHIILLFVCTFYLLFNYKKYPKLFFFISATWIGFFLYSLVFRWQPWQVRLMLPWMVLTIVPIGILVSHFLKNKNITFHLFISVLLLYACIPVYLNISKPIIDPIGFYRKLKQTPKGVITLEMARFIPEIPKRKLLISYDSVEAGYQLKASLTDNERRNTYILEDSLNLFSNERRTIFSTSRIEMYYLGDKYLYQRHLNLTSQINGVSPKIMLQIGSDSYEYPLWIMLRNKFGKDFNLTWKNYQDSLLFSKKDSKRNLYLIKEVRGNISLVKL